MDLVLSRQCHSVCVRVSEDHHPKIAFLCALWIYMILCIFIIENVSSE